ncbi:hypothetical protein FACS189443_1990 [Planctomycetales bacterium]|nr:hypothetical protein FACS189443_1990 [Planctomycetales bacterium]
MLLCPIVAAQITVKEVVRSGQINENLFLPDRFRPYESGFEKQGAVFCCDNGDNKNAKRGVVYEAVLNQKIPAPIIAEGWSKAENAGGSPSYDSYSLYMDISYADGTNKWGLATPFDVGTHDWQKKQIVFHPEKPVRSLIFHALFRGKTGKVYFKDLKLLSPQKELLYFDGVPIEEPKKSSGDVEKTISYQLRDVAANSDFVQLEKSTLGIQSTRNTKKLDNSRMSFEITLNNSGEKDRCLTFILAFNLYALKNKKFCDVQTMVPMKGEMSLPVSQHQIGSNGRLARYPFAAIVGEAPNGQSVGHGIAIDLDSPAFFRLGYNTHTDELFAAVDLALTKEAPTATLKFVAFTFEGEDGLRGAAAEYYQIFPDFFHCRTPKQGIWMPFSAISKIPDFEDFGFQFKEGNDETAWDDAHGITTFRYTEPMTWWMKMDKSIPRTYEAAIRHAQKLADSGDEQAIALLNCGMKTADGTFAHRFEDTPWCDGVVWSFCDVPGISNGGYSVKWNKDMAEELYKKKDGLDGEYIDSSEGYITVALDFDRVHFSAVRCPLVFSSGDYKPAIFRGLVAYEYVRGISEDIHRRGKLMMANATPDALCWLAPYLDVMGTETGWKPMSREQMFYRRVMCGTKPFCFLMNTDFTKWTFEMSEKFMKRCLAFGMFPGFFSADASTKVYFSNPQLYERDRPLFKKYIPLCREVAQAGWFPIPKVVSSNEKVFVERFGENEKTLLTIFNDSSNPQTATLRFDADLPQSWTDCLDGKKIRAENNTLTLTLEPEDVIVLKAQ